MNDIDTDPETAVRDFLARSDFMRHGGVMTDLDGTAVHERHGRATVSVPMEQGLKRMHDLGRAVVINSLRFPLSVIRTFGKEWYRISGAPIPVVSLRGSLCGRIVQQGSDLGFEELEATCLRPDDVRGVVNAVQGLIDAGALELLVFFYPRDWTRGEIIWTPEPQRIDEVASKYRSAARVFAGDVAALERELASEEICMVFRLLDIPSEQAMAYQHTERSSFITQPGVDKRYGAQRIAEHLGLDLAHSIGAGDSPMDDFLASVGLAVIVGPSKLDYRGLHHTVRLGDSLALGKLLYTIGELGAQVGANANPR